MKLNFPIQYLVLLGLATVQFSLSNINEPHLDLDGIEYTRPAKKIKMNEETGSGKSIETTQIPNDIFLKNNLDNKTYQEKCKKNEAEMQEMERGILEIRLNIEWLKKHEKSKFSEFAELLDKIDSNLKGPILEKLVELKGRRPFSSLIAWYGGVSIPKQNTQFKSTGTNEISDHTFSIIKECFMAELVSIWNDLNKNIRKWKDGPCETGEGIMGVLVSTKCMFLIENFIRTHKLISPNFLEKIKTFVPESH
ncbi:hypothetical protein PGT21_034434 [Puccinia graminis f. sp. tritici]|uniref:Uncharacterized protein n=1 Tax=Puccinia graminis f. sp. tritici TaxID=56615 RepID=A0A5B0PZN0_PUCGR|nr:hypothetical protein PGT21_034434 [Puccinia graminis f. sp. tritici]KAA1109456.1 hypothetical protein PGTUg99_033876 [Puccinia graminis f. sp. tritici]